MARNEAEARVKSEAGAGAGAETNCEPFPSSRGPVLFVVSAVVSLQVVANNDSK